MGRTRESGKADQKGQQVYGKKHVQQRKINYTFKTALLLRTTNDAKRRDKKGERSGCKGANQ